MMVRGSNDNGSDVARDASVFNRSPRHTRKMVNLTYSQTSACTEQRFITPEVEVFQLAGNLTLDNTLLSGIGSAETRVVLRIERKSRHAVTCYREFRLCCLNSMSSLLLLLKGSRACVASIQAVDSQFYLHGHS